jgi:hypothetical protein
MIMSNIVIRLYILKGHQRTCERIKLKTFLEIWMLQVYGPKHNNNSDSGRPSRLF